MNYTKFSWVLPCEFLGSHVFPNAGGFAFLREDGSSDFFAVVVQNTPVVDHNNDKGHSSMEPSAFEPSSHIQQLWKFQETAQENGWSEESGDKFQGPAATVAPAELVLLDVGDSHLAAVGMETLLCHGNEGAEGSSSASTGSKRYNDMHFLADFLEYVQRYDGAGDKCFLELEHEDQTDESDLGPRYGGRCVYEEVKAAVEKKWDAL